MITSRAAARDETQGWKQLDGCEHNESANITWRQEVGGSAIVASKIPATAGLEKTGEYTFVAPKRQNVLTRRIHQERPKPHPT